MVLASGQTVSEREQACIGHTVSQPNGLGQKRGEAKADGRGGGYGGGLWCQGLSGIDP